MHLATHAQQHGGHTDVRPYAMEVMGYMAMNDEVAAAVVEDGMCLGGGCTGGVWVGCL